MKRWRSWLRAQVKLRWIARLGLAATRRLCFGGSAPADVSIGLDADPVELPKTQERLRNLGFGPESFAAIRTNFAGLPQILAKAGVAGADIILADLGVSSMQLDDPARGFSVKHEGPLDMRMNPQRGQSASSLIERSTPPALTSILLENADEPYAAELASAVAGKTYRTTAELARAIRSALPRINDEARELSVRRVFQALRIAVNDEFSALETFLRFLPSCLNPGGRAAIITFHSGEDRRVKHAFTAGLRAGDYAEIAPDIVRPTSEERRSNPRSIPAKLRWARR